MASSEHNAVGELELSKLLSSLNPILDPELYVFVTLPPGTTPPGDLVVQMLFREREGMTVITTKESAIKHDFSFTFQSRMITLDVHSSLEAVGFIAKITEELTKLRIGVNPVSGYFHDHLFIADGKEEEVLAALDKIKQKAMAGMCVTAYDERVHTERPWRERTNAATFLKAERTRCKVVDVS